MTATVGKDELRRLHDAENADFSAYLHSLADADWEQPSLCEGWRVRDVVGHILDGNELRLLTLPVRLARYGFSSDKSGRAYSTARAEGRTPAQLLADFDGRDAWAGTCKVFPARVVLLDRLVHHQDIRRALGHHRVVPEDRLLATLDGAPGLGNVLGAKKRSTGFSFRAEDVPWSWGTGPLVEGPGEAILMSLLGRRQPLAELRGDGAEAFAARVRDTQPTTA
ncbi:MAG TPA: maleylpyruvate isomerase family mycothiol-dependent enzyme [Acidimicrobiales bacterium]|nr:maleylpyruvate isomerase family mycothiol-dependent enzyme [Acidimicrobiales bacterium]